MSRVVSGRYPLPGADSVADAIRERRGARGITPLDASLLHVPHIAKGYNNLLGAIRTEGELPGDIREAMVRDFLLLHPFFTSSQHIISPQILRIAALNHAAYEWIQHADLGRKEGLSSGQLYAIRDTKTPLPPSGIVLNSLQTVAIQFADESTCLPRVSFDLIERFKGEIQNWVLNYDRPLPKDELEKRVEDLYVEAAMVVATYNMVSRFLLSTDVAGMSDMEVPWPVDRKEASSSLKF
jgi:alkylhydroperoxidase family enzyme